MSSTVLLFAGYFALLAGALFYGGRALSSPWLFLLRSFFPNWRFYHALGRAPRLEHRGFKDGEWSDWVRMHPRATFRPAKLLHDPAVNLALTEQNLVDHLAADVAAFDGEDPGTLTSYRLVARLVREKVRDASPGVEDFQFRIRSERPGEERADDEDVVLVSPRIAA